MRGKGLQSISGISQGRSLEAGTEAEAMRNVAYCPAFPALLSYLSYEAYCLKMVLPTVI